MKYLAENLHDLEFGDQFLDTPLKAQLMKEEIEELNFVKIENLLYKCHC